MTRNQLLPTYVKNRSGGVMYTVDGGGNITPTAQQTIHRGETLVTQAATGGNQPFSGHVCARQNNACQCSSLVDGLSGSHMDIGTGYTVKSTVPLDSEFEIYAVTGSGQTVPNASNGDIVIGST